MSVTKRACGFIIFRRIQDSIEYLLMQTSYGTHHWTPPKDSCPTIEKNVKVFVGHVDPGESDFETALRETEEEAGFIKNDLKIFEDAKVELKYDVNGTPKIVVYWLAELINPDKSVKMSKEHQAYKWLGFQDACSLAHYSDMQTALKQVNEYIDKHLRKT